MLVNLYLQKKMHTYICIYTSYIKMHHYCKNVNYYNWKFSISREWK